MSSMYDFFVQQVNEIAITAVRDMFPSAEIIANAEFVRVRLGIYAPEQALMELSLRLKTDVMWLSYQSVVDWFEFYHWKQGTLLRALVYGRKEERIWERIEGQPEAWERQIFFDPNDLARLLEDEDESDEEKQQLKQFWQTGELVLGRMEPYLSAQSCTF